MSDTRWVQLDELTEPERSITYGVVKPGPEPLDGGVTLIRGGDISNGRVSTDLRKITEEVSRPYRRTLLRGGELIMSLVGNPGSVAIVPEELAGANLARQAALIALQPSVDARFVMYWFMSPQGRERLATVTKGSVQQVINLADLKRQAVPCPPLETQRRIASILGAYDDLIEVNRRRIAVLEEMARGLFEEWFARFRFPGHEAVPILDTPDGPLPEGWHVGPIREAAVLRSGFAFKSSSFVDDGPFSLVTIKHVHDGVLAPTFQSRLMEPPPKMPAHCYIHHGDILLSLTGNVGRACLAWGDNLLLNQRVAKVEWLRKDLRAFVYYWFRHPQTMKLLQQISNGVAQQNLSPVKTMDLQVAIPPNALTEAFEAISGPIMEHTLVLYKATANLQKQRDLLLPRLISGQLSVAEAERQLEEVA